HQASGLGTHITFDENFASGHGVPDAVQTIAGAIDADPLKFAHAQPEYIAHADAPAGCLKFDPLALSGASSDNQVRAERPWIGALIGTLPQGERKRLHGNRSRK